MSASTTSSNASNAAPALTPAVVDTTPPEAPTYITAVANSSNSVTVSWHASIDSTGGGGISDYFVLRSTNTTPYATIVQTTGTTYTDTGVSPSTTYYYEILARDAVGNTSNYSTTAKVTTPAAAVASTVVAAPAITAAAVSSTQINLNWSPGTSPAGIKDYLVYENGSNSPLTTVSSTSYGVTGLSPSTKYSFTVVAYDTSGTASALSNSASATTQSPTVVASPTLSVYGIVVNPSTSQPINGATVTTNSATGSNVVATTNSNGYYLLANVKPNVYQNYTYSLKDYATTDLFKDFSSGNYELDSYLTPTSTSTVSSGGYQHHFLFIRWH